MQTKRWTREDVQGVVEERQKQLEGNPLLSTLDTSSDIEDMRAIALHFHFFVLAFQDMLRLIHELIGDPALKEVALSLAREDAGHEQWYLFDVEYLGCTCDVPWLFGPAHQPVRDFVYQLMSDLFHASDDRIRIILPLVLEATGTVFFKHLVGIVRRSGYDQSLRYFSSSHQKVEIGHDIYKDEQEVLQNIEFDENAYREAIALVHRCFDSFERFADHLEHHVRRADR